MSAYLVSHRHIAAIVKFSGRQKSTHDTLDVANRLAAECVASVHYRYPQADLANLPGPNDGSIAVRPEFTFADLRTAPMLTPIECLKACACLEYQSCEHPGWDASEACRDLDMIRREAVRRLPGFDDCIGWSL